MAMHLNSDNFNQVISKGKVNVDENRPIAREYGVMSIPTVVFFVDGVEKERLVGVQPKQTYIDIINSL